MEERLSYLEGVYAHVATKAELNALETRLMKEMRNQVKWFAGFQLLSISVTLAGVAVLLQFLG